MADLGTIQIFLLIIAVGVSALIQGSIGFGFSFVAVPAFLLILPEALPPAGILLGLPMASFAAFRERSHIDYRGVAFLTLGRLPGTALAIFLLLVVPRSRLGVLFGFMLLIAVVLSAIGPSFKAGRNMFVVAGMFSGLMGTAAAVGGPPLGIVMQRHPAAVLRSTLGVTFTVGIFISISALAVSGQVALWHVLLSVQMIPALAVGLWASSHLKTVLDRGAIRPAVLLFAFMGAVGAIVQGLNG